MLSTAASGWFDVRCRRRGADGRPRRSDVFAVAGRIPAQDPPAIGVIRALNRNVERNSITIAAEAEAGPIALGPCVLTATTRLFL